HIYTLSLHDALPIYHQPRADIGRNPVELFGNASAAGFRNDRIRHDAVTPQPSGYVLDMRQRIGAFGVLLGNFGNRDVSCGSEDRSEEHTSELQSQSK